MYDWTKYDDAWKGSNQSWKQNEEPVTVVVTSDGAEVSRKTFVPFTPEYADALAQVYPYSLDDKGFITLRIPKEAYKVRDAGYRGPKPLMCGFHATKSYMNAMFGMSLDLDDEKFYETHPAVKPNGLPAAETLRVIQELIDPYGLRVSRVRLTPGVSVPPELLLWFNHLGVNPLALSDRITSNAEFAEASGMDLGEVDKMFRLDFGEKPLKPGIICTSGNVGTGYGTVGGHAQYGGPRCKIAKADMSLQLTRVALDPWGELGAPKFADLGEFDSATTEPDLYQMWLAAYASPEFMGRALKQPFGSDIDARIRIRPSAIRAYEESRKRTTSFPTTPIIHPDRGTVHATGSVRSISTYKDRCRVCDTKLNEAELNHSARFCFPCWGVLFYNTRCEREYSNGAVCGCDWFELLPKYKGFDPTLAQIKFTCTKCNMLWYWECEDKAGVGDVYRLALKALRWGLTRDELERWRRHLQRVMDADAEASAKALDDRQDPPASISAGKAVTKKE